MAVSKTEFTVKALIFKFCIKIFKVIPKILIFLLELMMAFDFVLKHGEN